MNDNFFINEFMNNESSVIPLFSMEDEENLQNQEVPEELPILPLRNTVLYPGTVIPITVGRNKSIKLAQEYGRSNHPIGVATQKANETEEPAFEDIYKIGTMARIIKYVSMPDGSSTIIVQGVKRIELTEFTQTEPYFMARVVPYATDDYAPQLLKNKKFNAIIDSIRDTALSMIRLSPEMRKEAAFALKNIESPFFLLNFISSNLSIPIEEKQRILEIPAAEERAKVILKFLNKELQMAELKNQIQHKSKLEMDKEQREYFLTQQMKTIQKELGGSPQEKAAEELAAKAAKKKWNKETEKLFQKELQKLQRTHSMSPDFSVQLNYLELLVDLPWNEYSKDNFDLDHAYKVLDKDHFGLEKIKERIVQYLAVLKLKGDMKSPILCLAGPPGVGKTSVGKKVYPHVVGRTTR
jgi:ATP-dependent Lon protease